MRTAATSLVKNLVKNPIKNQAKKLFIPLTEEQLNKISFTMVTFVPVLMFIFATGATNSTTQMTLAKTNISIHTLAEISVLIGFEADRNYNRTYIQKRARRASIPRPVTQEATTLSILRHKPSKKNTCNNLSVSSFANFLLNVNNPAIMFG